MLKLSNDEFIAFIESFNDFLLPVSEISKNINGNSLIKSDFKLYSLEYILFNMEYFKGDYPKTTDALFYKNENDKMTLYFIEFKFDNLDNSNKLVAQRLLSHLKVEYDNNKNKFDEKFYQDFKMICHTYEDKTLINLIFKIIESLNIFIPEIYEEYCKEYDIPISDIREYLRNIDKKLVVFSLDGENRSESMSYNENNILKFNLKKLVREKTINDYQIYSSNEFNKFLTFNKIL